MTRSKFRAGVTTAALAALLTACGGTPSPAAAPATVTVEVPVPAPPSSSAALAPAPQSWTMPDLVGSGLQDAQNSIQRLTGFGIAVTTSHDATGSGRMQVADRNWTVCTQNVAPGSPITPETLIDFGAVQLDETCSP